MNIKYDKDIDDVEIFFKKSTNYGEEISSHVMAFKTEKNDVVIGYSFEQGSKTVFESDFLHLRAKLAALLKMSRLNEGIT